MCKKYYQTKDKYLAFSLHYLGFNFYKFDTDIEEIKYYSFEYNDNFLKSLNNLKKIKYEKGIDF